MPYIKRKFRTGAATLPTDPGELNYGITLLAIRCVEGEFTTSQFIVETMRMVENYLESRRIPGHYTAFNEVMGVLACVPLELERRLSDTDEHWTMVDKIRREMIAYREMFYLLTVGPYEDGKLESNGDVFPEGWTT